MLWTVSVYLDASTNTGAVTAGADQLRVWAAWVVRHCTTTPLPGVANTP